MERLGPLLGVDQGGARCRGWKLVASFSLEEWQSMPWGLAWALLRASKGIDLSMPELDDEGCGRMADEFERIMNMPGEYLQLFGRYPANIQQVRQESEAVKPCLCRQAASGGLDEETI